MVGDYFEVGDLVSGYVVVDYFDVVGVGVDVVVDLVGVGGGEIYWVE